MIHNLVIKFQKMANPSSWDGFELGIKKFGKTINGFTTCSIEGEMVVPLSDNAFSYCASNFNMQIIYTIGTSIHAYEFMLFEVTEARWIEESPTSPVKTMLMDHLHKAIKTDWQLLFKEKIKTN